MHLPLTALFFATMAFVMVAVYAGVRFGRYSQRTSGTELTGSAVGATLALLAFILAFTFNMAAGQYDQRKQLLIQEIGVIKTVWLRAGLLPDPTATEVRAMIRDYVDVRVGVARHPETLPEGIARSDQINHDLWRLVESSMSSQSSSTIPSLFIRAANEMIELHSKRVNVALNIRIPASIWMGLYAVAAFGMITVGFQFGQSKRGSVPVIAALGLAFSTVILLIVDLDRATDGGVRVNQQPLYDLQAFIESY